MKKLDLIIDALQQAYEDTPGWCDAVNEALYAARELKALEPVAWAVKRSAATCNEEFAELWRSKGLEVTSLYSFDEVTK